MDRSRLRYALILCESFVRNLAYYRAARSEDGRALLDERSDQAPFWLQVHGNFLDQCVLDWCKLFAEERDGEHHWHQLVQDRDDFRQSLLRYLGVRREQYDCYVQKMRFYRDKFVAHLDQEEWMPFPHFDLAHASVTHLHQRIVTVQGLDLRGLANTPEQLADGFQQSVDEASLILQHARSGISQSHK
jgi:hypothetical protein